MGAPSAAPQRVVRRPTLRALLLFLPALVACSASDPPGEQGVPDAGGDSAPDVATGPARDAAPVDPPRDSGGGHQDGAIAPADAQSDSSARPPGASPPAAAKLCGQGTFAQAELLAGCGVASFALDGQGRKRDCGAATIKGGRWEVWCAPAQTYAWMELDGLAPKTAPCMYSSYGWADLNGSGTGMLVVPAAVSPRLGAPVDVSLHTLGNQPAQPSGKGTLFILAATCEIGAQDAVVGGVAVEWNAGR